MWRISRTAVLAAACGACFGLIAVVIPSAAQPQAQAQGKAKGKSVPYPGAARPTTAPPPGPSGPVPHMRDGKPDLSGIWNGQRALPNQPEPEMLPWAAALTKERTENYSADDPEARCLPGGVPRSAPYHTEYVQTPKLLLMLIEGNIHSFRQIFLDRTAHLKSVGQLWYGDSIGQWDGDTLVVDTVGFNDRFWFDMAGHPHTTQLHITERYHRRDYGNMDIQVTIDDPEAYTKPWNVKMAWRLLPDAELIESICEENNRDPAHMVGK